MELALFYFLWLTLYWLSLVSVINMGSNNQILSEFILISILSRHVNYANAGDNFQNLYAIKLIVLISFIMHVICINVAFLPLEVMN